jgi:linoleoyl-CoA desaturase
LPFLNEKLAMEVSVVRFKRENRGDFVGELRKRVNQHFVDNGISKFGNLNMVLKSTFMLALYLVPLGILIFGQVQSFGFMITLWSFMGLGMCGIGLSIMHDANHGSYSKYKFVNKMMGYLLNLIGSYHMTWKIQHNVLHHSSTNVHDFDEDLDNQILRFSPNHKHRAIHKFQAYFAPFMYGLLSLYKMLSKDFEQISRFSRKKLLSGQSLTLRQAIFEITVNKILYLGFTLALPIVVMSLPWWQVLIGFGTMHIICGFILAIVFQSAHVQEENDFCMADEKGSLDNCFAIHQLNTTANFGTNSRLLTWLIGGLNFQVEHHLFPLICHVHYKDISHIVKETAADYDIKYKEYPTFWVAIKSHFKMMHKLGQAA